MNYDPRLREAMQDIKLLLQRYNIGGHIILASESHTEFAMLYDVPSWSSVTFEGTNGIRVKAKKDSESDQLKLASTMHMLLSFQDLLGNGFLVIEKLRDVLGEHIEIEHKSILGQRPDSIPGES